jgi:hypothetical protein
VASIIENEGWRVADEAADLLSVDREVCRRAFYQEPEERVYEVVRQVLAERDLPEHDPERMIEGWAREHGAGVYGKRPRRSNLENIEGIVIRAILGREAA